ncbi:MAG TPA: hypothetical protein ENI57_07580, partial [Ignavibacteria bacterium]|nr:hypothetical protein [Ignavibacteria bacterium]
MLSNLKISIRIAIGSVVAIVALVILILYSESQLNTIYNLIQNQNKLANDSVLSADNIISSARTFTYIFGVLVTLFIIGYSIIMLRSIIVPLKMIIERAQQLQRVCITNLGKGLMAMSKGDMSVEVEKATKHLNLNSKDELGSMAATIDKVISQSQAGIDAYEIVREKINELNLETEKLINDSNDGKLDNRGDVSKFEGFYQEIVKGFNGVLDAVILPVQDGARVLEIYSTGDLTPRVTAEYKGQHQLIKNSINKVGESISGILSQVTEAVQATSSASAEISSSTEEMAAGAQEQSS